VEADAEARGLEEVAGSLREERVGDLWRLSQVTIRPVAKAAKRALYLLKLRGVEVGEGPLTLVQPLGIEASPQREPRPEPSEQEPCMLTPIDGFGDRALWIPLKRKVGYYVSQSLLSDITGVQVCDGTEMSRRQLHQFFEGLKDGAGPVPIEVPLDRALALLAEAVTLGPLAPGARAATRLISDAGPPREDLAAAASAPAKAGPDEAALLVEGPELFGEPELRSYVPPEEALRSLGARLDEIAVSPLLVDERQRTDQRRHAVDRLVEATFTPEARGRYARRLFELADYFTATHRPVPAGRAAATARHLAGTAPILSNPFARALFARLIREPASASEHEEPLVASATSRIVPPR
jgi:hypothetical protein